MSSATMQLFLLGVAIVIAGMTIIGMVRIVRGPTLFDRVLASSLIAINGLLLLLIVGFLLDRLDLFVDLAIAFAALGFLVPVAAARIVGRRPPAPTNRGDAPGGRP